MSITLPIENQRWPLIRILHREKWGGKATSGGGWKTLPMVKHGQKLGAFELLNCSRALLPQVGRATLQFQFGRFGNSVVGANQETRDRLSATGGPWIPGSDALEILDIKGHEIRIQAARDTGSGTGTYRTIWWGYVDHVEDTGWPGAAVPSGTRTYHCVDAFWRTKNWIMDKHGIYIIGSVQQGNLRGHPGYNVSDIPGLSLGNKESSDATYATDGGATAIYHTWPGAGNPWTDYQAIEHALAATRPADEPLWRVVGATDLFGSSAAWHVSRGMTVFDFVANICRRGRGRGAVLPTWADDSSNSMGQLTCELRSFAQVPLDNTFLKPSGGSQTLNGAATNATQLAIDLIGDHRVVDGSLKLGDAEKYRVDYLESEGEPIEVMVTLGQVDGTLAQGWLAAEATAFAALDPEERKSDRWNPVYTLQRLARSFIGNVGDGNGGGNSTSAYSCADSGAINLGTANRAASVLVTEVLNDLPLYEGYNYEGTTPARYDAQSVGDFAGQPSRKQVGIYFRTAPNRYVVPDDEEYSSVPVRLQFVRDGFMIGDPRDKGSGYRSIGDEAVAELNSTYTWSKVVLTVGLRLANPIRMATGNPLATTRSRMVIRHEDLHLWLAHPGAIWDLDDTTGDSDGYTPRRVAGAATPGLLRDDRDTLAYRHNLAVAWYGPYLDGRGNQMNTTDDTRRLTASWSLRDCCFLGTFLDADGTSHSYPALGWLLYSLTTNGQVLFPNTPFSSMSYDHTTGTTDIVTDWADLEFE